MDPPAAYSTPRTALPRPQSKLPQSRLPALRPTSTQLPRPVSPEARPVQQSAHNGIARPSIGSSAHRSTVSLTTTKSSTFRPPSQAGPLRQPLSPTSRPQSRHDSGVLALDEDHYGALARRKQNRNVSQQENSYQLLDSPEESDASESVTASPTRPVRRGPRPSLSDRTIESLSSIPASPAARRRSSFFNPQSPIPNSRPGSAMSHTQVPKLNHNPVIRDNGFVRPASPYKRPGSSGVPTLAARSTPSRQSMSSALPKSSIPAAGASPHKRTMSAIKPTERQSAATTGRPATNGLKASPVKARPMSMQVPAGHNPLTGAKPRGLVKPLGPAAGLRRPNATQSIPEAVPIAAESTPPAEEAPKSSAALRAQIAKAKASRREANTKPSVAPPSGYAFEDCEDPFNQGQKATPLERRIDAARRDGRLNIAALGLKRIPAEVLRMYDSDAMAASSVSWSETVDLVRLNAADNQIDEISEEVLPDVSIEELSKGEDAKGNQFGGIEHLDLHGNLLKTMPLGLRRLERLTVLNLSRNKVENSIFDVLQHMPALRELHLNDNELVKEVPESIGKLVNLEVLHLQGNKLTSLSGSIRNLVNLRVINLSNNRFAELPIGSLFSLPALKEVYAATNALTGAFFPMTVDIVRSLQTLDISNNSLASLSFGLELHLPAMAVMNVARNRLFALPNVSSWVNLVTLLAEENSLSALPDGLTSLKKLRTADFKMNSLRAIEPEVANMTALEMFGIAANPLRDKKLLTMSAAEIKDEMRKRLDAAKEPDKEQGKEQDGEA